MGLNTNSKRDAEVFYDTEARGVIVMCSSVGVKRCLYNDLVTVSIRESASRQAGRRISQLSDNKTALPSVLSTRLM